MTDSEIYKRLAHVEEQCIKLHHSINELRKLVSDIDRKVPTKLGPKERKPVPQFLQEIDMLGR